MRFYTEKDELSPGDAIYAASTSSLPEVAFKP